MSEDMTTCILSSQVVRASQIRHIAPLHYISIFLLKNLIDSNVYKIKPISKHMTNNELFLCLNLCNVLNLLIKLQAPDISV